MFVKATWTIIAPSTVFQKAFYRSNNEIVWIFFFILEVSTFQEWIRYRYGTFAEMGFENDPLYPMVYQYGAEEKSSQSCIKGSNLTQNAEEQMADASIEHEVSTTNSSISKNRTFS